MLRGVMQSIAVVGLVMLIQAPQVQAGEAQDKIHRVVFHLDENDPKCMNLVLNNVRNVKVYYAEKGEEVDIQVVAYGPGLHMLRADTSPVKKRIISLLENFEMRSFVACGNTKKAITRKESKEMPIMPEAKMGTAGVVHLMELQEQGWSYIRP